MSRSGDGAAAQMTVRFKMNVQTSGPHDGLFITTGIQTGNNSNCGSFSAGMPWLKTLEQKPSQPEVVSANLPSEAIEAPPPTFSGDYTEILRQSVHEEEHIRKTTKDLETNQYRMLYLLIKSKRNTNKFRNFSKLVF